MSRPRVPSGVGPRGRRFWRDVTQAGDLDRDELEILVEVVRTLDAIDALHATLAADGLVSVGSMGQPKEHPAGPALRQRQATLLQLLGSLPEYVYRMADVP